MTTLERRDRYHYTQITTCTLTHPFDHIPFADEDEENGEALERIDDICGNPGKEIQRYINTQ